MPKGSKIKKIYAKDKRHDACLRKIAFFNYEMENNIIMGRQIDAQTLTAKGVCEKKDSQNIHNLPLDHPPNCGPVIKSIDALPSGKVVSLYWPFPLGQVGDEEEDNTFFEALVCNMETVTGNDKEFKRGSLEPDVLLDEELIKYHKEHPERSLAENIEQRLNDLKTELKEKLSRPQKKG